MCTDDGAADDASVDGNDDDGSDTRAESANNLNASEQCASPGDDEDDDDNDDESNESGSAPLPLPLSGADRTDGIVAISAAWSTRNASHSTVISTGCGE